MSISNRYSGKFTIKTIPKESILKDISIDVLTNVNSVYQNSEYLKETNNGIIFQR